MTFKTIIGVVFTLFLTACASAPAFCDDVYTTAPEPTLIDPYNYQHSAKITRVLDGDTFDAVVDLGMGIKTAIIIRLRGFDAPETRTSNKAEKAHGMAAKDYATTQLNGRYVIITKLRMDLYSRYLAEVRYEVEEDGKKSIVSFKDRMTEIGFKKLKHYPDN